MRQRDSIIDDDESMCFLSDEGVKLFLRNNAVLVEVGSLDHLLEDSIVGQFTQVLGDLSQILESDEACVRHTLPVFWESKVMKTLWTSSRVSLSEGRVVIM
jgi:hypothetical protein